MAKAKPLTPREQAFVAAYLARLDVGRAFAEAGYPPTVCPWQVFGRPHIRAEIRRRFTDRLNDLGVTADRVLREIARIAFANPGDVVQIQTGDFGGQIVRIVDSDLWPADLHAAVKGISQDKDGMIKIEWRDKVQALTMLAKHLGMDAGSGDADGVKVFIVPAKAESEGAWEETAQRVLEQSRKRGQRIADQRQS